MAIVKFSQDDTQPFGTGIFVNDEGRSIYTTDPDSARALQPTPPPQDSTADAPTQPGTRVSYAGDQSSPYANALASNDGAAGSAAGGAPEAAVAKVAQVVPPAQAAAGAGAAPKTPEQAVSAATSVVPPIVKSSTTVVQGRKAANVEKQVGTDQAALNTYGSTLEQSATNADARAQASLDSSLATKTGQQTQLIAQQTQNQADQRDAEKRVTELTDLPDGKIDPDRFVNSLSTGGKIGMAVLAAISGFASGVRNAGGPNGQGGPPDLSVLNVLNRRIDQDIESQKDELAQGRIRKNNLIARAMAKGADAKAAETAARGQLWTLANQVGEIQAQKLGLQGTQLDQAKNLLGQMQYQATQHYGDLRATEEARISSTREQETGKPAAAGALLKLQSKALGNYDKLIAAGSPRETAYRESGMGQLGMSMPSGASQDETKRGDEQAKRSEDQGKVAAIQTAGDALAKARGLVQDATGNWVPGGKVIGDEKAAAVALKAALKAGGYDAAAIKETVPETPGVGSALLDVLPFGFLLSNSTTPEDQATQLNAMQSTLRPRMNPTDRNAQRGPASLGFAPVK